MKKASNGLGGLRYQITAAVLTYVAVSMAAVPVALHGSSDGIHSLSVPGLIFLGLASPFFELVSNVAFGALNLFIIFIGIRFAWRFTAGRTINVEGPFRPS